MSDPVSPSLKDLPKVNVDLKSELEGFKTVTMKKAETQEKNVLPTAEGISSKPLLLDENSILFSYSIRSSVLYCNTWNSVHSLANLCFSTVSHDVFSSSYLVLHILYVFFYRKSSFVVELKYNNKIHVYANTTLFFIPLVATSFGRFDYHQANTTQNLKGWLHVVYVNFKSYIYTNLLKIWSFFACYMIHYGFYWQRTV